MKNYIKYNQIFSMFYYMTHTAKVIILKRSLRPIFTPDNFSSLIKDVKFDEFYFEDIPGENTMTLYYYIQNAIAEKYREQQDIYNAQ